MVLQANNTASFATQVVIKEDLQTFCPSSLTRSRAWVRSTGRWGTVADFRGGTDLRGTRLSALRLPEVPPSGDGSFLQGTNPLLSLPPIREFERSPEISIVERGKAACAPINSQTPQ